MEAKVESRCDQRRGSLTAPLIAEQEPPKLEVIEGNYRGGFGGGDASFFKTFFNGLNALSGVELLTLWLETEWLTIKPTLLGMSKKKT
ncbi:hypothetical protein AKJ16_DCAP26805 [Drosera capensis]